MKLYECPKHDQAFEIGDSEHCIDCRRILQQIKINEEVSARKPKHIHRFGRESVYWPTNNSHEGRVIENLGNKPIHFSTKQSYRDHLKRHRMREAG